MRIIFEESPFIFIVCILQLILNDSIFVHATADCHAVEFEVRLIDGNYEFRWKPPSIDKTKETLSEYTIWLTTKVIKNNYFQQFNPNDIIWFDHLNANSTSYKRNYFMYSDCTQYAIFIEAFCENTPYYKSILDKSGEEEWDALPINLSFTPPESPEGLQVNNFQVMRTGKHFIVVSWSPQDSHSRCITGYSIQFFGYVKVESNLPGLDREFTFKFPTDLPVIACMNYSITLTTRGQSHNVSSTIYNEGLKVNDFQVSKTGDDWMKVIWSPPKLYSQCITSYVIIVHDDKGPEYRETLEPSTEEYELSSDTGYTFKPCTNYSIILIVKGEKYAANSTIYSTFKPKIPEAVETFKAINIKTSEVELTWTKPAINAECVAYYSLSWYNLVNGSFVGGHMINTSDVTSYKIRDLESCWNYAFTIYSGNELGKSIPTSTTAKTIENDEGLKVNNFQVSETSDDWMSVSWSPAQFYSQCIKSYVIIVYDDKGPENGLLSLPGPVETFKATNITTSEVVLAWTKPVKPENCVWYYDLSWYNSVDKSFVGSHKVDNFSVTSYKVNDLNPSWNYMFTICTVNNLGRSQPTNTTAKTMEQRWRDSLWFLLIIIITILMIIILLLFCMYFYYCRYRKYNNNSDVDKDKRYSGDANSVNDLHEIPVISLGRPYNGNFTGSTNFPRKAVTISNEENKVEYGSVESLTVYYFIE